MAAGQLLDLGHRRIVVIGGREGVSSHELRLKGCRAAFRRRGLALADDQVSLAEFTAERAYEETRRRMALSLAPYRDRLAEQFHDDRRHARARPTSDCVVRTMFRSSASTTSIGRISCVRARP